MSEIELLRQENEWLKFAIKKQEGSETLKQWMDGRSFFIEGMLSEREVWEKRKTASR